MPNMRLIRGHRVCISFWRLRYNPLVRTISWKRGHQRSNITEGSVDTPIWNGFQDPREGSKKLICTPNIKRNSSRRDSSLEEGFLLKSFQDFMRIGQSYDDQATRVLWIMSSNGGGVINRTARLRNDYFNWPAMSRGTYARHDDCYRNTDD